MDVPVIQLHPVTQVVSGVSRFAALFSKEWRESRVALLIGACIFLGMPTLWGLVYLALDRNHEPGAPFGLLLILGVGWLYAIVIGAHTVCRDWGRPEECFLLARPLSPRMAIGAKLLVSLTVVGLIELMAILADTLTYAISKGPELLTAGGNLALPGLFGLGLLSMVGTCLLSFAAAVVTRQTLTSTLLAVLVLVIWGAAPMIFRPLQFLHPSISPDLLDAIGPLPRRIWVSPNLPFICAVSLCIGTALAISFAAAGWERTLRLGHKTLAWVFALTVLVLFGGAMREVGNSLSVVDAVVVPAPRQQAMYRSLSPWLFVSKDGRALGMSRYDATQSSPDKRHYMGYKDLMSFRADEHGSIKDLRSATLYYSREADEAMRRSVPNFHSTNLFFVSYLSGFNVTSDGDWTICGIWNNGIPDQVFQMRISWPAAGGPRVTSLQFAVPKEKKRYQAGEARLDRMLLRFATTDRHAYVEYVEREPSTSILSLYTRPRILYVFDWLTSEGLDQPTFPIRVLREGTPEYQAWGQDPQEGEPLASLEWHGPTTFREAGMSGSGSVDGRYLYPAEYGPTLARTVDTGAQMHTLMNHQAVLTRLGEPDSQKIAWDQQRGLAMTSDRHGLRVFEPSPEGPKLIGYTLASPLSMIFRKFPVSLTVLSGDRLAELGWSGLILYDIADAAHPRRLGYFNVRGRSPQVVEVNGRLVLHHILGSAQQDQLLVLDVPGSAAN